MGPCTYCGYCEWFGCGNYSKASPQTTILPVLLKRENFSYRTQCDVTRINLDSTGKRATGVTYVDHQGRQFEQPASLVICCAWAQHNALLLLHSKIGHPYDPKTNTGVVGRNYAYQITSAVDVFLDEIMNPFMGAGALGQAIDEFNGDNFNHGPEGFIGGGYIALWTTGGRPILQHQLPADAAKWGAGWKKAMAENYLKSASIATHGSVMSYRDSYLDLDPTYRDVYGDPLLRLTFDFHPNEIKMSGFLTDKAALIARAMKPRSLHAIPRVGHYSIVPYQTTHNTGGCAMGANPKTSVVNKYLQSWDVHNVFVMGSSVFPQNAGYNPTGTVAALAYWAADAIKSRYLKSPGPLVQT
jgi:gluconate 2-dehydrogenase alpha chain